MDTSPVSLIVEVIGICLVGMFLTEAQPVTITLGANVSSGICSNIDLKVSDFINLKGTFTSLLLPL